MPSALAQPARSQWHCRCLVSGRHSDQLARARLQVFYLDTMKWALDLYGHKLPALALDISSDGTLLASGGADKNLKIWGLDFGDCHKSLFAHQDSVMAVAFVRGTHYVFSVGKDRMVKYWDADKFELLLELPAHHAEVRFTACQQAV
jgi:U3 small nucleolar RNA-associated protein 12